MRFSFSGFELDTDSRRLTKDGAVVSVSDRHLDVLHRLVSEPGAVIPKDALVAAGWGDVAVTDNSLEQAVSALRRILGASGGLPLIETVPRRGYRFVAPVTKLAARASDAQLDAQLAPHRAWLEGRAALETLERDQITRARAVFERVVLDVPDHAPAHVGLANACVMLFETTRTDAVPDADSLAAAATHAREACRLDAASGEAWATLGFVLSRTGPAADALAAVRRAVALEPDNWRHHFRLAYVSWGEERLRAARRTLTLLPGFPLAHWMAATVHVARNVLDEAVRELTGGVASQARQAEHERFSAVGLHWLLGLIHLARGNDEEALAHFDRELERESAGHLYARECCANTWYAIAVARLRQQRPADARLGAGRALERVPAHPLARIVRAALSDPAGTGAVEAVAATAGAARSGIVDTAMAQAALLVLRGDDTAAADLIDGALAAAPEGNAGWLLPVEPLLNAGARPDVWAAALARLRARAA